MIQSRLYRSYQLTVMYNGHQQPGEQGPACPGMIKTGFFQTFKTGPWFWGFLWLAAFLIPILIDTFILGTPAHSLLNWAPSYFGGFSVMLLMVRAHRYKMEWLRHQHKPSGNRLYSLWWLYLATAYAPWAINRLETLFLYSSPTAGPYHLAASTIYLLGLLSVSLAISKMQLMGNKLNAKQGAIRTTQIALANAEAGKYFMRNILDLFYAQHGRRRSVQHLQLLHRLQSMTRDLLDNPPEEPIPLSTELEFMRTYIELQNACFGRSAHLETNIRGVAALGQIAPFIAMPLLEEAFSRIAPQENKEGVRVSINSRAGNLCFHVVNSRATSSSANAGKGAGLQALAQRLELIYPDRYLLEIIEQGSTYSARLRIPLQFQATCQDAI